MGQAFKCDKCGELYEGESNAFLYVDLLGDLEELDLPTGLEYRGEEWDVSMELCDECTRAMLAPTGRPEAEASAD